MPKTRIPVLNAENESDVSSGTEPVMMNVLDDFHLRNRNQSFVNHLVQMREKLLNLLFGIDHAGGTAIIL